MSDKRSVVEHIKENSRYLRGTLAEGLVDPLTGAVAEDDTQLTKFHGIYQQDDRELRSERRRQKLEPAYIFMIRVRLPGGVLTPAQWLALDEMSRSYANGSLRLTTRQTFQFHGVLKRDLKKAVAAINASGLDTVSACGDVNRNVIATADPHASPVHRQAYDLAQVLSTHLRPRTRAYQEIWLDEPPEQDVDAEVEPIYGHVYLPRKFKIALAVPPSNDVDVYAHDLGLIAIHDGERLQGYNVTVGGGMGMSHSEPQTYPRLGSLIGFCRAEQVTEVAEQVLCVQRDFGDRSDRKHARLKYTIDDRSVDWFKSELESRLGWALEPAREFRFERNGDPVGWARDGDGLWHFTLFVENGRVRDEPDYPLMTGLREIAHAHEGEISLTTNQNIILTGISDERKPQIEALLKQYRLEGSTRQSALRVSSMACVALPTCGLAMAESERSLPGVIDRLDTIMTEAGLADEPIVVRMTGCPNGCARPYLGEIAFVGKSLGRYNVYLGAGFVGDRMNKLYKENVAEDDIPELLSPIIHRYAREREPGEHFGDFVIRQGYVKAVKEGRDFHA